MKKTLFFILILLGSTVFGQKITINGYVQDRDGGRPIPNAKVIIFGTEQKTYSNEHGFYKMEIVKWDTMYLVVFAESYVPFEQPFRPQKDTTINLEMIYAPYEVLSPHDQVEFSSGKTILENAQIRQMGGLGGEPDPLVALQSSPGISHRAEGTSELISRGGNASQNLVMMDGIPLYYPNHMLKLFSPINHLVVNQVEMTRSSLDSKFSGRLGPTINVLTKEGNFREHEGEVAISLATMNLNLSGPIVSEKASYSLAFRRTFLDTPLGNIFNSGNATRTGGGFFFMDGNLKVVYKPNPNTKFILGGYFGMDQLGIKSELNEISGTAITDTKTLYRSPWSNRTGYLKWNQLFGEKLFASTSLYYSEYSLRLKEEEEITIHSQGQSGQEFFKINYKSGIMDFGMRSDWELRFSNTNRLEMGLTGVFHMANPGQSDVFIQSSSQNIDRIYGNPMEPGIEFGVYVQDHFGIGKRFGGTAGATLGGIINEGKFMILPQPNLSLRYLVGKGTQFSVSGGYNVQALHQLEFNSQIIPYNTFGFSSSRLGPQKSIDSDIEISQSFPKAGLRLFASGYFKEFLNLTKMDDAMSLDIINDDWISLADVGSGRAYGVEVGLEKKLKRTSGRLYYHWGVSDRVFSRTNNLMKYPDDFNRKNNITLALNHKFSRKSDMEFTFYYGSGQAVTIPSYTYLGMQPTLLGGNGTSIPLVNYAGKNSYRLGPVHRSDIVFNYHVESEWGGYCFSAGVYNWYGHLNPSYLTVSENDQGEIEVLERGYFPFFPFASFSVKY